jgi:N-acetylmuramoyl-L-alanine amidase
MSNSVKRVSIEIGHGGNDPGAVRGSIREKDINLVVGLELRRQLERHGVKVLVNRTTDVGFRVADFREKVITFNPDVGVSVHTNAFNGTARGFEVFRNTNAFRTTSNLLCAGIEREVKKLGQTSRGIKDSPFLMSSLSCPTAYLELGFLDNPNDYKQFDTPAKQRSFAVAYAKGILDYFGISPINESSVGSGSSSSSGTQLFFRVMAGSFSKKTNAQARVKVLKSKGFDALIMEFRNGQALLFRVMAGSFSNRSNAQARVKALKSRGFDAVIMEFRK